MSTAMEAALTKEQIIAQRRAAGADRWDEVWDGEYMLMPLPNDEHQDLVGSFNTALYLGVQMKGLGKVRPGVNVSDQHDDWTHNYRCPDVVVYLNESQAENRDTYWLGGPDFAIEIVSPKDRTRDKLEFYASVGMRELLIVDRDPWQLELYRLIDGMLEPVGTSTSDSSDSLSSEVVPFEFALQPGGERPSIRITHRQTKEHWQV